MGRSGNIGWGISNYFGLPNRKKKLLTIDFLKDFKNELIQMDMKNNKNRDLVYTIDYEKESYMSFYGQIQGTYLFYKALENTCRKHNLTKAIYEYARNIPWFDSDCFNDDLVLEMVKKGVIEYGSSYESYEEEEDLKAKYKLVKKCNGYNVLNYGSWFDDSREVLEEIYKDGEWELIWVD